MKHFIKYFVAFLFALCLNTLHAQNEEPADTTYTIGNYPAASADSAAATQPLNKAYADSAYAAEDYSAAAAVYAALLQQGESPDLYYNLGNCYYKTDSLAQAILFYERAALLQPGNSDIRFNLELARSKTIDQITPESEMFFITWTNNLIDLLGVDAWACVAAVSFLLACILTILFFLGNKIWIKKTGFFGAAFMLLLMILANIFARVQYNDLNHRTAAIVMSSSVVVKSTPNESGTDLFVLHEGTRVEIVDNTMREWKEVKIADGKRGWMLTKDMEVI